MKTLLTLIVAAAMGIASVQSSKGIPYVNLVNNGSFESGDAGWGWTYNYGVGYGFPSTADGGNFAIVYGTIFQTILTVPGTQYDFRFALAGNPNDPSQTVDALWGNTTVGSVTWSPDGHTINNLGWVYGDFHVLATGSSTLITLSNPYVGDGSGRIAFIDAISVNAVPDTSAYLTPAFALFLIGLFWARKRTSPAV